MTNMTNTDTKADDLWITDAEMIRRLGIPEKIMRENLRVLDAMDGRRTGFPQKSKLNGNRRYWPAVRAYYDLHYGLKMSAHPPERSERHVG